jgi:SAM-dependent methyltransferase
MQQWWTGLADAPTTDATAIHALGLGFMAARTLHVALEFDLFTQLSQAPHTLTQVAESVGLAERAAARLLRACAALGLLHAEAGTYANTPVSDKYLVRGRPTYMGSYVQLFDHVAYHRWGQMGHALRHDRPVEALDHPYRYFDTHAEDAKTFLSAQHDGSASLGYALARRFDFSPFACLLDLGGGTGTYTIEILKHYPHLNAIVFDFPPVCAMAESALQAAGLSHRVSTVGGDYERDPLPTGPDVVVWSGNLHASSPERCRDILTKLRALLPAHGAILIHDYLLDDAGTGPLIPALLALHMTLVSEHGQVYSSAELRDLLTQTGFTDIDIRPFLPGHSGLVSARVGERTAGV